MELKRYNDFLKINEKLEAEHIDLVLPSAKEYKDWVLGEGDDDGIDIDEDAIDMCAIISHIIAKEKEFIDEDDDQYTANDIDYVATMGEWLVYADKKEQKTIVKKGLKILNNLASMSKEEKINYFGSLKGIKKFNL